jgi:hypothetical protein
MQSLHPHHRYCCAFFTVYRHNRTNPAQTFAIATHNRALRTNAFKRRNAAVTSTYVDSLFLVFTQKAVASSLRASTNDSAAL